MGEGNGGKKQREERKEREEENKERKRERKEKEKGKEKGRCDAPKLGSVDYPSTHEKSIRLVSRDPYLSKNGLLGP